MMHLSEEKLRGHQFDLKHIDSWTTPVLCAYPSYILRNRTKLPELKEDILNSGYFKRRATMKGV